MSRPEQEFRLSASSISLRESPNMTGEGGGGGSQTTSNIPVASNHVLFHTRGVKEDACLKTWNRKLAWLTVGPEDQRGGRAVNLPLGHAVHHHARVVANVRRLHLRDVQVPGLLGHETSAVLLNEVRVLVKDPGIAKV